MNQPSIYIAGASAEIDRAERMILLISEFMEIRHDWTKPMRANPPDDQMTDEMLLPQLRADLKAVDDADAVLVLVPKSTTVGAWFEVSRAIARRDDRGTSSKLLIASVYPNEPRVTPWVRLFADHIFVVGDQLAVSFLQGWVHAGGAR